MKDLKSSNDYSATAYEFCALPDEAPSALPLSEPQGSRERSRLATCSLPRALAEEILGDMQDLRGEWEWRKNEPRCGNDKRYADLSARIDMLDAILRGQENAGGQPHPTKHGKSL